MLLFLTVPWILELSVSKQYRSSYLCSSLGLLFNTGYIITHGYIIHHATHCHPLSQRWLSASLIMATNGRLTQSMQENVNSNLLFSHMKFTDRKFTVKALEHLLILSSLKLMRP